MHIILLMNACAHAGHTLAKEELTKFLNNKFHKGIHIIKLRFIRTLYDVYKLHLQQASIDSD